MSVMSIERNVDEREIRNTGLVVMVLQNLYVSFATELTNGIEDLTSRKMFHGLTQ